MGSHFIQFFWTVHSMRRSRKFFHEVGGGGSNFDNVFWHDGPTLNAGLVALWFFRRSRPALYNPSGSAHELCKQTARNLIRCFILRWLIMIWCSTFSLWHIKWVLDLYGLSMHAHLSSGPRSLTFGLSHHLLPFFMNLISKGFIEPCLPASVISAKVLFWPITYFNLAWVSVWSFFLLFYFSVLWSKMMASSLPVRCLVIIFITSN